jgi:hypothetical protein
LNSHGKPLAEFLIEQGLEPGPELLLEGNKTSKSASASERHRSWRPTHCPRRESAAVPSHPTLLLPSNCNPWSNSNILLYSQHQEKVGETPEATFKTCQHHRGCSCEPWRQRRKKKKKPTPRAKGLQAYPTTWFFSGAKESSSTQFGTVALSWTKSPWSFIDMMDKTAKNEEQREKGILIEEYD